MYQAALRQTERATEKVSKLPAIEFIASICKVQTLADGGIRLTLDLPEDAIAEAAMLMQIRQAGEVLTVHAWAGERAKSQTKQLGDLSQ